MPSPVDLKVAEEYRGNILVVGTELIGVAKRLLPEGASYEEVLTGWFMRLDGHFSYAGSRRRHGCIRGVQFRGVTSGVSAPESVTAEEAARTLRIPVEEVRGLTREGVLAALSADSHLLDRASVARHQLPNGWAPVSDISITLGVNEHHIRSLVDAGAVRARKDVLGRLAVSPKDVSYALSQHRA